MTETAGLESTLFYRDNLEVLRTEFPGDSVDLIYLDPPFNSNATYEMLGVLRLTPISKAG